MSKQKRIKYIPGTKLYGMHGMDNWVFQMFMPKKITQSVLSVFNVEMSPIMCDGVKLEKRK